MNIITDKKPYLSQNYYDDLEEKRKANEFANPEAPLQGKLSKTVLQKSEVLYKKLELSQAKQDFFNFMLQFLFSLLYELFEFIGILAHIFVLSEKFADPLLPFGCELQSFSWI